MTFLKQKPAAPQEKGTFDLVKIFTWVKSLETKINSLTREFELIKNESLRKQGSMKHEIKQINDGVTEVKHAQEQLQQSVDLLIKEIKQTAGTEEVEVIKKYIEYWNPLNFVTQKDLERLVDMKLAEAQKAKEAEKHAKKQVVHHTARTHTG